MNDLERLRVSAHLVDARGKPCPMPIVELARALIHWSEVELWADDPAAQGDVRAFTQATGHELLEVSGVRALVRRRP